MPCGRRARFTLNEQKRVWHKFLSAQGERLGTPWKGFITSRQSYGECIRGGAMDLGAGGNHVSTQGGEKKVSGGECLKGITSLAPSMSGVKGKAATVS